MISQVSDLENSTIFDQACVSVKQLGIPAHWQPDWEGYIVSLTKSHVHINEVVDEIIWTPTKHGTYYLKSGYPIFHFVHRPLILLD